MTAWAVGLVALFPGLPLVAVVYRHRRTMRALDRVEAGAERCSQWSSR